MAGTDNPYERFSQRELILRDHLAIDRTILANERTLLAYARTALALVIVGATFLKFLSSQFAIVSGWAFIFMAVAITVVGIWRFKTVHHRIAVVQSSSEENEKELPR